MSNDNFNELIPIIESDFDRGKIKAINARDLWQCLKSKDNFGNWIKSQIKNGNFKENKDFIVFRFQPKNLTGGRPKKEYHLTIVMAKKIGMMSATEKGNEVRDYFIAVEKQLYQIKQKLYEQYDKFDDVIKDDPLLTNYAFRITNAEKVKDFGGLIYTLTEDKKDVKANLYRDIWNKIIYPIGFHANKPMILNYIAESRQIKKRDTPLNYMEIEGFNILAYVYNVLSFMYDQCNGDMNVLKCLMETSRAVKEQVKREWKKCMLRKGIDENIKFDKHRFLKELFRENPITLNRARKSLSNAFEEFNSGQTKFKNFMNQKQISDKKEN